MVHDKSGTRGPQAGMGVSQSISVSCRHSVHTVLACHSGQFSLIPITIKYSNERVTTCNHAVLITRAVLGISGAATPAQTYLVLMRLVTTRCRPDLITPAYIRGQSTIFVSNASENWQED